MKREDVLYWIGQLDERTVENPIRRVQALRILAPTLDKYPWVVDAVIKRLKEDSQSGVRQGAATILGEMARPTRQVREVLAWAAENDDMSFVQVAAANALVKFDNLK
jgi:hypothetical protein